MTGVAFDGPAGAVPGDDASDVPAMVPATRSIREARAVSNGPPTFPGHAPGAPFLGDTRLASVRDLTPDECDLLEYEGPLAVSRREYRFLIGPWRPSKYYVVSHRRHGQVLVATRRELATRGVAV